MAGFADGKWKSDYRVVEKDGWFSPQQHYPVRGHDRWFSLLRNGYWADPDGWNADPADGEDIVVYMQTREMAEAAIAKAMKINGDGSPNTPSTT